MVVPTDVQVCFIVGALLADVNASALVAAHQASPRLADALYTRYRFRALAYAALFVGPAAAAFYLGWPGWESQYWSAGFEQTAGDLASASLFALFLLLLFAGAWLGNWVGFRWVLAGARTRLRILYTSVFAATVALVAARWPAPIRLGTYAEFHADPTAMPYIWDDRAFMVGFVALTVYCVLPLPAMLFCSGRNGRRVITNAGAAGG